MTATALASFVVGMVTGAVVLAALKPVVFGADALQRRNYRHAQIATAAGVVLMVAVALLAGVAALIDSVDDLIVAEIPLWSRLTVVIGVLGFGSIGLLDDLVGDRSSRGFAGHLRALARRRPTTGSIKVIAGGAFALVIASTVPGSGESLGRLILGGSVIALASNTANLFDLAPARTTKVASLTVVGVLAATGCGGASAAALAVLGAALVVARAELAEQVMLGDTGANALGAVVGILIVAGFDTPGEMVALAALIVLNAASEFVSFSAVIRKVAPLRWLDEAGRRPPA